eukprot:CAMPEP_0178447146 /NCGR_PEP_ID=MMETSP0689_2-20121128/41217_1 /TAXON_ID=160604 /ORGANISM="Amphidinium massartii, Strain CS-259" /LENGTH=64 /DNA_ID=CAMNT_0020072089 /DNA_START=345 /DNA_END=539 /DNA_ORIENTATION=-
MAPPFAVTLGAVRTFACMMPTAPHLRLRVEVEPQGSPTVEYSAISKQWRTRILVKEAHAERTFQ